MAKRGRSINVFLIDGEVSGKIKVSISNWNGVVFRIPRSMLDDRKGAAESYQSGVYFLFGDGKIYIGQAEVRQNGDAIYRRIVEHTTDHLKDQWDEVIILTAKDGSLGRTDLSFLESMFYEKAVRAKRSIVLNNNVPSSGTVTEEKRSELEEFADLAELILGVLGYKVFTPKDGKSQAPMGQPPSLSDPTSRQPLLPRLPDTSMKIGKFISTAMRTLADSGLSFAEDEIDEMCTVEWTSRTLHSRMPFMKRYIQGTTDNKGADGRHIRYWSQPFKFGQVEVLISKEWYERHRPYFIEWYSSLNVNKDPRAGED